MKLLDDVKLINNKKEYNDKGVFSGMIGTIIDAEIRFNEFHVVFQDQKLLKADFVLTDKTVKTIEDDITLGIKIEDLELINDNNASDYLILENLPEKYPNQWCKVENGFILNLKGEKKNKIAFDYDS